MNADTYVYVIAAEGDCHTKIGIAYQPEKRLRQIQTGNPYFLYIARQWGPMPRSQAEKMEVRLHEFFGDFSIRGEWFFVNADEISAFVSVAMTGSADDAATARERLFEKVVHG
ncbi:GIY-YIG nuclease family protein [Paracoccus versutus]|uniref:Meiotically Up-regulated Gene 113 (MUG113) protein n=1 Tax=Paracoccus versutus TaxID=34007 RepID=A0A3D9XZJ8_PARVE|nr:GIY-YIG nuclease family protein [Paracoccus versutus]REF72369.1 Meiotically Up-regulated Gene 113 (MUG113) protein [Paracoccus versutus]WGR55655.1 GIY-YIG nuclease family protein [Paracoccus versutus]